MFKLSCSCTIESRWKKKNNTKSLFLIVQTDTPKFTISYEKTSMRIYFPETKTKKKFLDL